MPDDLVTASPVTGLRAPQEFAQMLYSIANQLDYNPGNYDRPYLSGLLGDAADMIERLDRLAAGVMTTDERIAAMIAAGYSDGTTL